MTKLRKRQPPENPVVYIVTHREQIVNVYRDYVDAVDRAVSEVEGPYEETHIDVLDYMIYVTGARGEIAIVVEELL